ncbi:MAG: extracellular solute-binding protein [Casimicrobiaceae bacterium]
MKPTIARNALSLNSRRGVRAAVAAALVAGLIAAGSVAAQGAAPSGIGLATYQGADRMQRIIDGAKKEGEVSIYTSAPVDDMKALADAFEKKYGVKVKVWRASSEKVLQRGVTEARAGRFDADVFETNGPEMEALVREKVLTAVQSPTQNDLIPEAKFAHHSWVGSRLNIFAFGYNTNLVKKEELPKKYEDLLDPRWKGRLGIEAEDADWFAGVCAQLGGQEKCTKLWKDIVTKNGMSVRKGHTLLTNLVVSGEIPMAVTVYNYKAEQLKNKGAPIDWFVIPPAIARANGVGVAGKAAHPHAALLWYEFEIGDEGQKILLSRDFIPTNKKVETNLNKFALKFVDPAVMLDQGQKWEKLYQETFAVQGK